MHNVSLSLNLTKMHTVCRLQVRLHMSCDESHLTSFFVARLKLIECRGCEITHEKFKMHEITPKLA